MENLRSAVLEKYGVDIEKTNLFGIYGLDPHQISWDSLEAVLAETRKRWEQESQDPSPEVAQHARYCLAHGDAFDRLLMDTELREKVLTYYRGILQPQPAPDPEPPMSDQAFARRFFRIVASSHPVTQEDIAFYYRCFPERCTLYKAVDYILRKEFHIRRHKNTAAGFWAAHRLRTDEKKEGGSPVLVNRIREDTVLSLKKCTELYEQVRRTDMFLKTWAPGTDLYTFLQMESAENAHSLRQILSDRLHGLERLSWAPAEETQPLQALLREIMDLTEYRDITDNFDTFRLLIRYPRVTPYLWTVTDVKPGTLQLLQEAVGYCFTDTDFLLQYLVPVSSHLDLNLSRISGIIRKARKAAQEDFEPLLEKREKLPPAVRLAGVFSHLSIYVGYFLFEVFQAVVTGLRHLRIPVFLLFFLGGSYLLPGILHMHSPLILLKLPFPESWKEILYVSLHVMPANPAETLVLTVCFLLMLAAAYVLLPWFMASFVRFFAENLQRQFDWIGVERTFRDVFAVLQEKIRKQYTEEGRQYLRKQTPAILLNIFFLLLSVGICVGIGLLCSLPA